MSRKIAGKLLITTQRVCSSNYSASSKNYACHHSLGYILE